MLNRKSKYPPVDPYKLSARELQIAIYRELKSGNRRNRDMYSRALDLIKALGGWGFVAAGIKVAIDYGIVPILQWLSNMLDKIP